MPLGASILDLLPVPSGTESAIPTGLRSFLERFTAVDLTSSTTRAATFHYGTLLPTIEDTGIQDAIRGWSIEGAGFDRGVRFQLAATRLATVNNIEPPPTALQLDLFLEQVSIVVPPLKAARLVPGSGTTPAHLLPDPASSDVRLTGTAILRITNGPSGWGGPFLVDFPDPLVPGAPTGSVASMQFVPPHFFVANSAVGLTVRQLTFDASTVYTPADITARSHGPDWTGLAINEALLYLPRETPLVGSLVLGVRDVLLGDPFGMQGELRAEWGADAAAATPVQVSQATDANGFAAIPVTSADGEFDRTVVIDPDRPLRFFAQVTSGPGTDATVRWILPDRSTANGLLTPEFRARSGDTLVCIRSATAEGSSAPVDEPEIRHHFTAGPAASAKINVTHGGLSHANVVHVSGSREAIAELGLVFSADPASADPESMTWQLGDSATAPVASGATFALNGAAGLPASGRVDLVLDDNSGDVRRVRIQCLERASLLIGAEAGVFDADGTKLIVQAVERTVELNLFHDDGSLVAADNPAQLEAGQLVVPTNALAQVTVDNVAPAAPFPDRHVRVRMVFDEANPSHEGEDIEAVEQLLADFPGARLVLIGRCDDVGDAAYNAVLARERATAMGDRLIAIGVAAGLIIYRGEQDDPVTGWVGAGAAPDLAALGVPADQQGDDWYAFEQEDPDHPLPNTPGESGELRARREEYRRVDIYAEGDPATGIELPPADGALASTRRRAWVPGPDGESPAPPAATSPELIHRVSVRVAWDSPTATTLADFVPTLAEVTVAYESERLSEPANMPAELPGTSVGTGSGAANSAEVLTVTGRWTYDARSGETLFAASVDSTGDPLGLFYVDGDAAALAAAFGPAVVATVSPAFPGAGAVGIAGVATAAIILQGAVKNGSGRVVCTGLAVEQKQRALDTLAGSQQQMLFDYESSFDVDLSVLNVLHLSTSKPLKVRYRNVGIRLNWSQTSWWNIVSFVYEGISMEVVEPGQWQIDGPLGKFLGIVAVRMGTGSTWFEVDMAFNLDLGVVRLTSATIRIVAEKNAPLSVEIRGLGVALSIPGVLEGGGTARISPDGSVAATLDVNVVAAGLLAQAQLELTPAFAYVAISVKVILPVGIPLANTGLGIFGFVGQFVSNGERTMSVAAGEDPVQAELDWYESAFVDKWGPAPGQWALGLGVVIGTLPDMGFTFNAEGMFVVAFPDPSVILGIDAKLLASPGQATDEPQPLDGEMRLVGLTVIDPEAVMIGVRGAYEIPKVLTLNVPLSAYFPLAGDPRGGFVHLGSDNVTAESKVGIFTRPGDPVSMTLLPAVLDAKAWAYFMLEERELHWLGNAEEFEFDGFSIGFGAGWNLTWKAGPLTLDASAELLVGLGTSPFKLVGAISVDGLLDAKIGSVGVSGRLIAEVLEQDDDVLIHLSGEFCGEIDLPLAPPIKKCIEIEIGSKLVEDIPVPPHPLRGVDLTSRRGNRVAAATDGTPGTDNTAWPDTVPVLSFSHVPEIGPDLEEDWTLAARPNNPSPWAGTSELKYAFRLDRVELLAKTSEGFVKVDGPLDAVFWLPTHRGGVLSEDEDAIWPSEHEGAALALLSWVPFTVFRHLANGGEGLPADPVETLEDVCDTIVVGHETCAPGIDAERLEPGRIKIRSRRLKGDPVAAVFTVFGTAALGGMSFRELGLALSCLGLHPIAEGIVDLNLPVVLPDGRRVQRGYELPGIAQAGPRYASLGWEGRFEPAIAKGQAVLEVCDQGHGVMAPTRCFPFDGVDKVDGEDRWETAGLRFVKTITPVGATVLVGSNGALIVGRGTLRMIFPFPVNWASLSVVHPLAAVTLTIKGLGGQRLGTRVIPRDSAPQTIVIEHLGPFCELVFVSLDGRLGIELVCVRAGLGEPDTPLDIPPLVGQRKDGELVLWDAQVLVEKAPRGGQRCRQILYTSPDAGGWQAIGIPAMQSATIRLVGVCGLTTTLEQVRIRDQEARDALKEGWNVKAGLTKETRPLLAPDTEYKLRVAMSWAGWRPTSPGAQPPATVAESSWKALPEIELSFLTAAEGTLDHSAPPLVPLQDETSFDPRAVARYLIGFEPESPMSPPHFLDDALLAHFEVDHVEQLLTQYGRSLVMTLRRTNPPAGSAADGRPEAIPLDVRRSALDPARLDKVDARVITALRADPRCLATDVNTGGVTLSIKAELEPDAEYDLALFSPAVGHEGNESLLVARTHFRSSRYADVSAMLTGLGFGLAERSVTIPFDFVIGNGATMPAFDAVASDAALGDALRVIGMDPWPVVGVGRVVAIWRPGPAEGEYLLAGLLLESPEPIERGARCGVVQALVTGGASDVMLTTNRVNTAGTRVLLATDPAQGLPLDDVALTLSLQMLDRLVTRTASRAMRAVPRIAYQELR